MGVTTFLQTTSLLILTAFAEIVGCYLPYLWLRRDGSPWLLLPAALSLSLFAWLLTLHPTAAGRTYASYGGIYIATAVLWLWLIDGQRPDRWDLIGAGLCLLGVGVIVMGPRAG
jgi:small multidrug resistance family-3 protein